MCGGAVAGVVSYAVYVDDGVVGAVGDVVVGVGGGGVGVGVGGDGVDDVVAPPLPLQALNKSHQQCQAPLAGLLLQ